MSRSLYESSLADWMGWARKGEVLFQLAKPLERKIRDYWKHQLAVVRREKTGEHQADLFTEAYFMLVGFGLENHLKAYLIYDDVTFFSPRRGHANYREEFRKTHRLPKALREHDLYKLATAAGFEVTLAEEDLLRKLTRATVWSGRYPIPLDHRDSLTAEFSSGKRHNITGRGPNDVKQVQELVAKLRLVPSVNGRPIRLLGSNRAHRSTRARKAKKA